MILAGFWRRFVAEVLDALLLGATGWAIGYPFRYVLSDLGSRAAWIGLVVSLLYAGLLQSSLGRGQTLGKRALGIQVLRRDGGYLRMGASMLRFLVVSFVFYNSMYGSFLESVSPGVAAVAGSVLLFVVVWMFFACFLMIPLHPLKRGLHDVISGSVVVRKGRYDAALLAQLENPRRARRALGITAVLAVVMLGGVIWGIDSLAKGADMAVMKSLRDDLAKNYQVTKVSSSTWNGAHRTLNVEIWITLRVQENEKERERLRAEVLARTRSLLPKTEEFEKIKIWMKSGFQLGIANMSSTK
jgi:uncharacterized RDD family membrane protein YckC